MMNNIKPYGQALSIVVVGRFNPAIFQPLWFEQLDIFSKKEIDDAIQDFRGFLHRDITDFRLDWCHINVTEQRFMVSTRKDPYFERLRKLVYASFDLLYHTPITALGINPEIDYNINEENKWHKFGHRILPKEDWKEITNNPGLKEVQVKDTRDNSKFGGYSNISIASSDKIKYGIYIRLNEHFQLGDIDSTVGTKNLLEVLENEFEPTMQKWEKIHNHLIGLVG